VRSSSTYETKITNKIVIKSMRRHRKGENGKRGERGMR
jgi:hypothetical protein